ATCRTDPCRGRCRTDPSTRRPCGQCSETTTLRHMPQNPSDVPAIDNWSRLLEGKVAVVTGGGDGIGGAISRLFAEHGAQVEIAEIDAERAERKVAEIEGAGGVARAHVVDVRVDDDVARLRDA